MNTDLDPTIWGPPYWFFLHTLAQTYPVHPTPVIRRKYYDFFQNLPLFLPHGDISNNMIRWLDQYPVTPYLKTRESLCRWVVFLHNKVNQWTGKEQMEYQESLERYRHAYLPQPVLLHEKFVVTKTTLVTLFICFLVALCIWAIYR